MWWEWNQNSGMSAWRDCASVMLLPHFEVFCYLVLSLLSSLVKDWFINFICLIFHLLQCPHDVKCARSDAETRDHPCNFEQRVQLALCQVCNERDKKVICLLLRFGFINWIDKTNWPPWSNCKASILSICPFRHCELDSLWQRAYYWKVSCTISSCWPIYVIKPVNKLNQYIFK